MGTPNTPNTNISDRARAHYSKEYLDARAQHIARIKAALDARRSDEARRLAYEAIADGHDQVGTRGLVAAARLQEELSAPQQALPLPTTVTRRTKPTPAPAPAKLPPFVIHKFGVRPGYYTVVDGERRGWLTFKVELQSTDAEFAPGGTVVSKLVRSENDAEGSYVGVAFMPKPDERTLFVYKKHRNDARLCAALRTLNGSADAAAKAFAVETGHCPRCGRHLSTPQSLASRIGPECAEQWGWPYLSDLVEAQRVLAARAVHAAEGEGSR